jgi:uncharacterized membrane protein
MANNATTTQQEEASIHDAPIGHGNSPAAWTCVFIMMIGVAASCVGFVMASHLVFWSGLVVVAIGLVVGWIMKKAGFGVDGHKLKSAH